MSDLLKKTQLIGSFIMSESLTGVYLWWATKAIRSQSLIWSEWSEQMSEFPTLQNGRQIQPDKSEADPGPLGSLPFWPDLAKMDLSWLSDPGFEHSYKL